MHYSSASASISIAAPVISPIALGRVRVAERQQGARRVHAQHEHPPPVTPGRSTSPRYSGDCENDIRRSRFGATPMVPRKGGQPRDAAGAQSQAGLVVVVLDQRGHGIERLLQRVRLVRERAEPGEQARPAAPGGSEAVTRSMCTSRTPPGSAPAW